MAIVKVEYMVKITQIIDWADEEIGFFNYDNLCANLDVDKGSSDYDYDVKNITVDGKNHFF